MNVLKIKDRDYVVKFTFASHIKMQELGVDVTNFDINGMPNFAMVRDLLCYGLEKFHNLSKEECEDLIDTFMEDGGTLENLLTTIIGAYTKSLGVSQKEIDKNIKTKAKKK